MPHIMSKLGNVFLTIVCLTMSTTLFYGYVVKNGSMTKDYLTVYYKQNRNDPSRLAVAANATTITNLVQFQQDAMAFARSLPDSLPTHLPYKPLSQNFSCLKLSVDDNNELTKFRSNKYTNLSPTDYIGLTKDCQQFRRDRVYITHPLTSEEAEFPIAYSLVIFKDVEYFERLLRAIYRPQNYYCVHVDEKAVQEYKDAVNAIASCFHNVFLAPRSVEVRWGKFSVLESELICMEALWQYTKWKYFINLTGQEFPLKTNLELVRILNTLRGANNAEGTIKRRNTARMRFVNGTALNRRLQLCPANMTPTKGSVHIVAQRGFIDFILHNDIAINLRDWSKDTGIPDETFFSTLNYNPKLNIPGSYRGEPETDSIDTQPFPRNPFIARYKVWANPKGVFYGLCGGKRVRGVCVFGIADLPRLVSRKELFANKFHIDFQPEAYDCLEEFLYNRTRQQVLNQPEIDLSFYEKLDIVHNHVP